VIETNIDIKPSAWFCSMVYPSWEKNKKAMFSVIKTTPALFLKIVSGDQYIEHERKYSTLNSKSND